MFGKKHDDEEEDEQQQQRMLMTRTDVKHKRVESRAD
jgi:hypothetical protein